MRPTWFGRTPRTRRSSTTLRNRHERALCRLPTPAQRALATVRGCPQRRLADHHVVLRPGGCGRLAQTSLATRGLALPAEPVRSAAIRERRTVKPPMVRAHYNLLYSFQGRPCGRPPAAAVLGPAAHAAGRPPRQYRRQPVHNSPIRLLRSSP